MCTLNTKRKAILLFAASASVILIVVLALFWRYIAPFPEFNEVVSAKSLMLHIHRDESPNESWLSSYYDDRGEARTWFYRFKVWQIQENISAFDIVTAKIERLCPCENAKWFILHFDRGVEPLTVVVGKVNGTYAYSWEFDFEVIIKGDLNDDGVADSKDVAVARGRSKK